MTNLSNHFAEHGSSAALKREQHVWFIKAREDRERREQSAEKLDDDLVASGVEVILATEAQIRSLEQKLDLYETATIAALMENQKQLDIVNRQIEVLLERAYVMDDGRRVFKTEDGTQVFDEHGTEVLADELDPELIDENRPSWESYQLLKDQQATLEAERQEQLEYQERLDAARDQLEEGDVSDSDHDELDSELTDFMPDSVRKQTPGMEPKQEDALQVEKNISSPSPVVSAGLQTIGTP